MRPYFIDKLDPIQRQFLLIYRATLPAFHHHLFDLGYRFRRVQALGAGLGAVHDRVAAIEPERVLKIIETFPGMLIAAVDDPAIGLQQDSWPQEPVRIPPIARAGGRATGT